jgi:hypothetical protein
MTLTLKKLNNYTYDDIAKAIMICRGVDNRTINQWFNALWKLEYLLQPSLGVYSLNLEKIAELEIPLTHTQILGRR